MSRPRFSVALARAVALVCALSPAVIWAASNGPVNLLGPDVMYLGVTENVTYFPGPVPPSLFEPNYWTAPPATLGTETPPQVLGNDLVFTPSVNFRINAQNGGGALADGTLSMQIMTQSPSAHISDLVISEGGGYAVLGGSGNYVQDSLVASFPAGGLTITRVGNTNVNIPVIPTIAFAHTGGSPALIGPDSIRLDPSGAGSWSGTATYDIDAALAGAGLSGNVTKLSLSLDDILFAQSNDNGGFVSIDKKAFSISPQIILPEPGGLVLGVIGAGLVVGRLYRRKAADSKLLALAEYHPVRA